MSLVVQCLNCAQQFEAPDEARGLRLQCPACGAAINIPSAAKSNAPVMTPLRGGMLDLLDEESRLKPGGVETSKGFDMNTVAALGISERKLYTGKSKSFHGDSSARPLAHGGPWELIAGHKLVLVVIAASIGFFVLLEHLNNVSAAIISCTVGILIAIAAWQTQALKLSNRKVADDWRSIQRWTGSIVLALIFAAGTWHLGSQVYFEFSENVPREGLGKTVGVALAWHFGEWLLVVGYCLVMLNRTSKFGFFKAAAWSYVLAFFLVWGLSAAGKLPVFGAHAEASPVNGKSAALFWAEPLEHCA